MSKPEQVVYQNNPFFIALDGLKLIFSNAKSVAIAAIVISVLGFVGQGVQTAANIASSASKTEAQIKAEDAAAAQQWKDTFASLNTSDFIVIALVAGTALFLIFMIAVTISGVGDYTAARLAKGEKTTLGEAFNAVFSHIGSYLWVCIIVVVKVTLWSLLLIIPGIIMAVRYSLSGVSFFADGKRGNEAVKHSLALTKGAWLTTFSSSALWNMITLGAIELLLLTSTNAMLYRQYSALEQAKQPKPAAHILSWLTLIIPFVLVSLLIMAVILAIAMLGLYGAV